MVPAWSEVGDVICIFAGDFTPFILRRASHDYILVRECYIHGLMEGQALQQPGFGFREISLA